MELLRSGALVLTYFTALCAADGSRFDRERKLLDDTSTDMDVRRTGAHRRPLKSYSMPNVVADAYMLSVQPRTGPPGSSLRLLPCATLIVRE